MYMPANSYLTRTIPDCTEAGIPWQCMVILRQGGMKPVRTTRSYRSLPDLAMATSENCLPLKKPRRVDGSAERAGVGVRDAQREVRAELEA
jgi:hypothetical protein